MRTEQFGDVVCRVRDAKLHASQSGCGQPRTLEVRELLWKQTCSRRNRTALRRSSIASFKSALKSHMTPRKLQGMSRSEGYTDTRQLAGAEPGSCSAPGAADVRDDVADRVEHSCMQQSRWREARDMS